MIRKWLKYMQAKRQSKAKAKYIVKLNPNIIEKQ